MEKRVFLAFILSIGIALLYQAFVLGPRQEEQRKQIQQYEAARQLEADNGANQFDNPAPSIDKQKVSETAQVVAPVQPVAMHEDSAEPEEELVLENEKLRAVFSSRGGALKSLTIKESERPDFLMIDSTHYNAQPLFIQGVTEPGENAVFTAQQTEPDTITFIKTTDTIIQKKIITLVPDTYELHVSYSIQSADGATREFDNGINIMLGTVAKFKQDDKRELLGAVAYLSEGAGKPVNAKIQGKKNPETITSEEGEVVWGSVKDRYFALIVKPEQPAHSMGFISLDPGEKDGLHAPYLTTQPFSVTGSEAATFNMLVYAGPQIVSILEEYESGFEETMYFSGILGPINRILIWSLTFFYGIFKSFGVAIIILTLIIKIIFYPFTKKSFKSMKQMQQLQPKVAAIRERYKDDQQKIQQEMMALYKREKVNPLGGCLPMLIQLPIFFSLFRTLSSAYELIHAKFLWIDSLSAPDRFYMLSWGGTEVPINILPLVMGITMFVQQKMSTADPQQQKMMMFMPVLFTFMLYNLPSGLVLYWTLSNVISIVQQRMIKVA